MEDHLRFILGINQPQLFFGDYFSCLYFRTGCSRVLMLTWGGGGGEQRVKLAQTGSEESIGASKNHLPFHHHLHLETCHGAGEGLHQIRVQAQHEQGVPKNIVKGHVSRRLGSSH
jgi:hypothetical protein